MLLFVTFVMTSTYCRCQLTTDQDANVDRLKEQFAVTAGRPTMPGCLLQRGACPVGDLAELAYT